LHCLQRIDMTEPSVLIIDDEKNILATLRQAFELEGFTVGVAGSGEIGLEKIESENYDIIFLDLVLPVINGIETLKKIHEIKPFQPVVMMSGHASISQAVESIKFGALDFLEKPLSPEKAILTIRNILRLATLDESNRNLRQEISHHYRIIGNSDVIKNLLKKVDNAAPSRGRVLITGESGTGKELIARRLHFMSDRASKPFVKVNCAAIPSELIESELFGHKKGSFTGAIADRMGKFKKADGGTLFLDEVGDMKLEMQAKLLRVLQEGEFEPVGSETTVKVDVRVIAATNRNLEENIREGSFRSDLFYRLNVIPINVPPLRERAEDIPLMAEDFIKTFCEENNKKLKVLNTEAMDLLKKQSWYGNVRQLRNLCEQIVILLPNETTVIESRWLATMLGDERLHSDQNSDTLCSGGKGLKDFTDEAEKKIILSTLKRNNWNMSATATELKLERSHLYKKCRALGIDH
jgi:two-component system nitrogen regulation response regulator NtrX